MKNENRYTITLDAYIYAENDEQAKKEAEEFINRVKDFDDNQARKISLHETPFASFDIREIK